MIRSSAECTVQPDGFSNWISLIDYDSPNYFDYCKDNDYYIYIYHDDYDDCPHYLEYDY